MKKLILLLAVLAVGFTHSPDPAEVVIQWDYEPGTGIIRCYNHHTYMREYIHDVYWFTICTADREYMAFLQYDSGTFKCWGWKYDDDKNLYGPVDCKTREKR